MCIKCIDMRQTYCTCLYTCNTPPPTPPICAVFSRFTDVGMNNFCISQGVFSGVEL